LLIEDAVVVEVKPAELSKKRVGLLINFQVEL
jgi:hypothetical protein